MYLFKVGPHQSGNVDVVENNLQDLKKAII